MPPELANRKKILVPALSAGVLIFAVLYTTAYVAAQGYQDRIAPNVFIAETPVGGMDPEAARALIQ